MESLAVLLAVLSILVLVFFGALCAFMLTALYVAFCMRRNAGHLSEQQRRKDYHQSHAIRGWDQAGY